MTTCNHLLDQYYKRLKVTGGFTLIELLASIAVVAILAALVIAGIPRIREHALSTKDISNLKTIGMAHSFYMNDNNGSIAPGHYPVTNEVWFSTLLRPYLDYTSDENAVAPAFISPLDPDQGGINTAGFRPIHRRSYAINRATLLGAADSYQQLNISNVPQPATTLYATNFSVSIRNSNWVSQDGNSLAYVPDNWRSTGGIAILFMDGHVELVDRKEILPDGRRNNIFLIEK